MAKDTDTYIGRMEHFAKEGCMKLSLHELRLYLYLFHLNNRAMWREWFEVGNMTLAAHMRLPESNLIRAKKGLKEKSFIDFIPGKRGKPSKYRLSTPDELETLSNYTVKNDSVTDSVTDSEKAAKRYTPQGLEGPLRHKTKDIRHRERKKGESFSPPTLEEIKVYVKEKGLPIDPQYFFDYFTEGDWHDSKGNQVKSWKQKALTWARYSRRDEEPPPEVPFSLEEQAARQMAEDERQRQIMERID